MILLWDETPSCTNKIVPPITASEAYAGMDKYLGDEDEKVVDQVVIMRRSNLWNALGLGDSTITVSEIYKDGEQSKPFLAFVKNKNWFTDDNFAIHAHNIAFVLTTKIASEDYWYNSAIKYMAKFLNLRVEGNCDSL